MCTIFLCASGKKGEKDDKKKKKKLKKKDKDGKLKDVKKDMVKKRRKPKALKEALLKLEEDNDDDSCSATKCLKPTGKIGDFISIVLTVTNKQIHVFYEEGF